MAFCLLELDVCEPGSLAGGLPRCRQVLLPRIHFSHCYHAAIIQPSGLHDRFSPFLGYLVATCSLFVILDIKGHVSDVSPHFQLSSRLGTSTLCHEVPEFSLFRRVSSGRRDIPDPQGYLHVLPVSILTPSHRAMKQQRRVSMLRCFGFVFFPLPLPS